MWPARAHRRAATAPACLSSPSTPGRPERRHALPRTALTPSRSPSSLVLSSPSAPERCRRHRSPSPWPPALPSRTSVSKRTASAPSSSSMPHATGDAPQRLHRPRLQPRPSEIVFAALLCSGLPRASRPAHRPPREPLLRTPLLLLAITPSRPQFRHGRSSPPLELVAGVAPATLWPRQCT